VVLRDCFYVFKAERCEMNHIRLPHSEIPGSKPVCGYPRLIAAYHVLHRLPVPRHPLHTLYILHCLSHFVWCRKRHRNGTQALLSLETFRSQLWLYVKLFKLTCMQLSKNLEKSENNYLSLSVVGRTGLEPVTPALSRRCSNQLSYMPFIQAWTRSCGA
jgi:hypothetical protein